VTGTRETRERELAAWYDGEVARRAGRDLAGQRTAARDRFAAQLTAEGRRTVVEIGCGPGHDGAAFTASGLAWSGVDLASASVEHCRSRGLDAHVAPVHALPFADGAFAAGWSMSVLMHVADADVHDALAELVRVLEPGAPLAMGTWGAAVAAEGPIAVDGGAPRFFSLRTDDRWRAAVEEHGTVEQWTTWTDPRSDWHYQWLVLRV
jgi:SAM-dependent methyltransferase